MTENLPLKWSAFARAMETLIALRGSDLLRVKGFLDVEGCRGPVLVQFVQHLAHPPVELAAWPDGEHGSRIVFITRNISEAQVRGAACRRARARSRLRSQSHVLIAAFSRGGTIGYLCSQSLPLGLPST